MQQSTSLFMLKTQYDHDSNNKKTTNKTININENGKDPQFNQLPRQAFTDCL